jgi:oxygen-dependent protoporphyrinogen oxidase
VNPRAPVVVIGAGISGLATAYHLRDANVVVLEASWRAGGKLHTIEVGGVRAEAGADSFVVRKPWAAELCSALGLDERVVIPGAFGAFARTSGGLVRVPERSAFGIPGSVRELLRWPGLARRDRVRALADMILPGRAEETDEALGALLRRRLGVEASRILVEPLLGGLHAGDPMMLSVRATFPELAAWERGHGSLIRGARAALRAGEGPGQGRRPMFATVWGGLGRLVEALEEAIGPDALRLASPVSNLSPADHGYSVETPDDRFRPDAVVLATPAFEAARLLREVNPAASGDLRKIPYASTAVVVLVYPPGTGERLPPDGTGFVVPRNGDVVTACTWASRKWPSPELGDRAVLRCFVGRAGSDESLSLSDGELIARVQDEVERLTPFGSGPAAARVVRWERSMPQYQVGHLELLERIDRSLAATPGLFVTGSAYRGIGIADCVRQARDAAERVRTYLQGEQTGALPPEGGDGAAAGREAKASWTK